jgi:putative ABC transport system permease protein
MQVGGSTKQFSAVDFPVIDELLQIEITDGSVSSDRGLLVKREVADEQGFKVGDTVTVVFQNTGPVPLTVLALYDNSSVLGNWVIDENTYNDNFIDHTDVLVAAKSAPGVSSADARATLEEITSPYPQLKVEDKAEFKQSREDQLNQLLVVILVFLILAIVIAGIGILITLALSVFERTRELGLLRAVGMQRPQLRRMIRIEAVIVAVFGALMGVVVGVAFGVALAIAIPDDVISTVDVPWILLFFMIVIAGLLGVVAAVYPAWRAGRLKVLDAIGSE